MPQKIIMPNIYEAVGLYRMKGRGVEQISTANI